MSKAERPYSRVYLDAPDDEKFAQVWSDDAALALWLRLLIAAEASYPEAPYIPRFADDAAMCLLEEVGLIDLVGTDRYRVHGLQSERERRSEAGRKGGLASGRSRGGPPPPDEPPPQQRPAPVEPTTNERATVVRREREQGLEQESHPPTPLQAGQDEPDALDAWYRLTASWPSQKVIPWLNELSATYGDESVSRALAVEFAEDPTMRTLLSRTQDRMARSKHHQAKVRDREDERRRKEAADAERERIMSMPVEQRQSNLARLRAELVRSGLMSERAAGRYAGGES